MSYDILFQQALTAHQQGRFDEAENLYRQILETAPEHPDILNLLGLIAQAKGVHNQAMELFYRAIQKAPKHAPFYFNLSISLAAQGKNIEALDNLQKAAEYDPDVKEVYNRQGLVFHALHRLPEAQQAFLKALQLDKDYSEAKTNLAMTYYETDQEKALKFLEDISNQYPDEVLSRYFLSTLYFDRGEIEKSKTYALAAQNLNPASDEISLILGLIAQKENNFADAKMYFTSAVEQNPRNIAAMLNLANMETNENNFDAAEKRYKKALDFEPNNLDAHINYANMLYHQGRLSEALEEYRAAVVLDPKSAETSNNIGVILKDMKDYENALGLFFNAYSLNPEREEFSINIAETLTLFYRQEKENAQKIAENWLKHSPDNVFAQHVAAAFKGEKLEDNKVFSEKLFDSFADNYELVLEKIAYGLPDRLKDLAGNVEGTIIDLGCGTGLIGQALKSPKNQIIGIDISQNMLDKAAEKGVYKELVKSDILDYCQTKLPSVTSSLVVAADVFGYIGNLTPLFEALKGRSVCFSIEVLPQDGDYKFNDAGRYQYNQNYVDNLLQTHGFNQVNKYDVVLRQENGEDVKGLLYFAK